MMRVAQVGEVAERGGPVAGYFDDVIDFEVAAFVTPRVGALAIRSQQRGALLGGDATADVSDITDVFAVRDDQLHKRLTQQRLHP